MNTLTDKLVTLCQEHGSIEVAGAFFEALVEMEHLLKGSIFPTEHKQVVSLLAHLSLFDKSV